ncbi:MAG: EAL domain-containing protein [Magnetococcales bacterium]|nr:EAL domain-containing protein [Magnetococcales bacterium]
MDMPILSSLRVKTRIWLVIWLAIACMMGREVLVLYTLDQEIMASRKSKIHQLVDVALSILNHFHQQEIQGHMTRAAAQQAVIQAIKILRYHESDYFWLFDAQPVMIMHPFKPELDGKDLSHFADPTGKKLFVAMTEQIKANGQGFVGYMWPKPGMDKPIPKLSFVKEFPPWGWNIGTGLYMDDLNTLFWDEARKILSVSVSIIALMLALAYFLARSITLPIQQVSEHITRITAGDLTQRLDIQAHGQDEISQTGQQINLLAESWQSEMTERKQAEEGLRSAYQILERRNEARLIINKLHETIFERAPIQQQLELALDIIFSLSWFDLTPKGAIFLLEEASGELVLTAQRGFDAAHIAACARIQPDQCLCGKTISARKILFSPCVASGHEIHWDGMTPHGHYCVPLVDRDRCLGILDLTVPTNHVPRAEEEAFLITVANTITGLINRRSLEEQLDLQANFDHLTGLPNRALFHDRLNQALSLGIRNRQDVVLIFIDLDHFKLVNDTMGHEAGDRLLCAASQRITSCLRASDTVARLGGDEFTVILNQLTSPFYVELVARKILEQLAIPFVLFGEEFSVSGSMGITFFPHDATDAETLLKNADSAMYQAKKEGRATFRFFTQTMQDQAMQRIQMEKELRQALDREEFLLYYQPKVCGRTGRLTGMEALVRWNKPGQGLVAPGAFIQTAEESGLIVPLGVWILQSACQQNKAWLDANGHTVRVAVNLSARQFQQGQELLETVTATLAQTGLPPEWLELEITESMVMGNVEQAILTMQELRRMGVHISLDDFGTGYSSLAALKRFPLHSLKIDRSFVTDLPTDAEDAAIVSATISMAHKMNLAVVAEGVETAEQLAFLRANDCDDIQGYYYSRPLPVEAFTRLLVHNGPLEPAGR